MMTLHLSMTDAQGTPKPGTYSNGVLGNMKTSKCTLVARSNWGWEGREWEEGTGLCPRACYHRYTVFHWNNISVVCGLYVTFMYVYNAA